MNALESKAQALFLDYSRLSNEALRDAARADIDALAQAFAGYFVGASPTGVMGWAKDETLPATLGRTSRHIAPWAAHASRSCI